MRMRCVLVTIAVAAGPTRRQTNNLPDPGLAGLRGNGNNAQFIGGECVSSSDCALGTACCARLGSIGVCSGLGATFQAGKTGCGFGDGNGNGGNGGLNARNGNGGGNARNGNGGGNGNRNGGGRGGGRGNGNGNGNGNGGGNAGNAGNGNAGNGNAGGAGAGTGAGAGAGAGAGGFVLDPNAPGAANVGKGNAQQFITGQCISDADCASTCCATGGKCAARLVVEEPQDPRECGFVGSL
ncbi:hypothetical protein F5Y14DRAFT_449916 [Nemania sp. NC0429]|nr:hypothetical protein F5Y14DRAFT_449916 [Nemania sp. NC0429]